MVSLNAPRPSPKGSAAVTDALNLLASFGGGSDDLKKLLQETKAAIAYNEKLISDAQVIMERADEIRAREERIEKRAAEADVKFAKLEEIREGFAKYEEEMSKR